MEYVEGETLRARLRRTRLTIREALDNAIQIASALSAAHAAGIVHRDIKPENVMLRPDGFVKVLDFGLAKLAPAGPELAGADTTRTVVRTDAGIVVGTVAYMSPEQARAQEVDARTDVWALGCVLYEMIAGRSPFQAASSSDVLAAILDRDPPLLARFDPEVPQELQRIVTKALRKERSQRYQTMPDLALDLEALREELRASKSGSGVSHGPVAVTSGEASTRARLVIGISLLSALVFVLGALGWMRLRRQPDREASVVGTTVQRNLTRLTFDAGLQTDPAFSPDGRLIAYASDKEGNFDVWVQPVSGGNAVQVTKSPAADTQPSWSPDGSTIAFRSERDSGGLYLVPFTGGQYPTGHPLV